MLMCLLMSDKHDEAHEPPINTSKLSGPPNHVPPTVAVLGDIGERAWNSGCLASQPVRVVVEGGTVLSGAGTTIRRNPHWSRMTRINGGLSFLPSCQLLPRPSELSYERSFFKSLYKVDCYSLCIAAPLFFQAGSFSSAFTQQYIFCFCFKSLTHDGTGKPCCPVGRRIPRADSWWTDRSAEVALLTDHSWLFPPGRGKSVEPALDGFRISVEKNYRHHRHFPASSRTVNQLEDNERHEPRKEQVTLRRMCAERPHRCPQKAPSHPLCRLKVFHNFPLQPWFYN